MPVFFVAAALSMSTVAQQTGALKLLTDSFFGGVTPWLDSKVLAVPALYWGGFLYHFATASEISMLATSLPVLMEYAKAHHLDVLWIGMVWSFSAGGKLFAYQSAPLVIGYSYGYFRHTDLIKDRRDSDDHRIFRSGACNRHLVAAVRDLISRKLSRLFARDCLIPRMKSNSPA